MKLWSGGFLSKTPMLQYSNIPIRFLSPLDLFEQAARGLFQQATNEGDDRLSLR